MDDAIRIASQSAVSTNVKFPLTSMWAMYLGYTIVGILALIGLIWVLKRLIFGNGHKELRQIIPESETTQQLRQIQKQKSWWARIRRAK